MRIKAVAFAAAAAILAMTAGTAQAQQITSDRYVAAGYVLKVVKTNLVSKRTPTPSADHIFYNPTTGDIVVGITNHPQRSGYNGEVIAPGDCYASFNSGITGANFEVADMDGNGLANDIILHRTSDGRFRQFAIELTVLFPGCDTTDAF